MSEKMLEKIIVITGKTGLFRMLSQTRTGVIATSLIDGKKTATNPREQINVLTEIKIYGIRGEVPLEEVFNKIFVYEKGESTRITPKAKKDELEAYLFEVFQDYDQDRVYASDIKKIIQWYNLLLAKGILKFEAEVSVENSAEELPKESV
tara:strand:- start:132 stop:581 length:450 start_codon:yes stop_codon:yes gene_type:complete